MCTPGASCDIRERKTGPASDLCCCRVSCLPNDTAALGSRASRCVLERPRRQKRRQLRAHIAQQKTCRLRHRQVMMACRRHGASISSRLIRFAPLCAVTSLLPVACALCKNVRCQHLKLVHALLYFDSSEMLRVVTNHSNTLAPHF